MATKTDPNKFFDEERFSVTNNNGVAPWGSDSVRTGLMGPQPAAIKTPVFGAEPQPQRVPLNQTYVARLGAASPPSSTPGVTPLSLPATTPVTNAQVQAASTPYAVRTAAMGYPTQADTGEPSAFQTTMQAVPGVAGAAATVTAAAMAPATAALWATGIGAGLSILGTGANIWMSLYAMKEQRKEARKTRAMQMSLYEDQKATEAAQFNRIQGREDEKFIEEKKWKLADARNAALTAWRNMMLEQPQRIQSIFNANKMYRRA